MKYYNGDQKNGKTLRDIQNITINRKLPNIYVKTCRISYLNNANGHRRSEKAAAP
jgi:hypothetical protein